MEETSRQLNLEQTLRREGVSVHDAIHRIDELAGNILTVEGRIGHHRDSAKILRGMYEETWITDQAGTTDDFKIRLAPSIACPRPFRFRELVHGSGSAGLVPEVTHDERVRFCGRLERCDFPNYSACLHDLRSCDLFVRQPEYRKDREGVRFKVAEHEFMWRFALGEDAPDPEPGQDLAEFLKNQGNIAHDLVRVSGVLIIQCNVNFGGRGIHILTPTLAEEGIGSRCTRIELSSLPGTLSAILMGVDIEDRIPDFRVFRCILEGQYQPDASVDWIGKFHNLRELVVLDPLCAERDRGGVNSDIRAYLHFPKQLLL